MASTQKSGGCKKKRRQKRHLETAIARATEHSLTRQKRHKNHGHSYTRSTSTPMFKAPERQPGTTFDDEYQEFKKSGGRRGLNPNPKQRQTENPMYLARNSIFSTRRVPIGELMEKPISALGYSKADQRYCDKLNQKC